MPPHDGNVAKFTYATSLTVRDTTGILAGWHLLIVFCGYNFTEVTSRKETITNLFISDEVELVEEGVVLGEVLVLPGAHGKPPLLAEYRAVDRRVLALALLQALKNQHSVMS